MDEWKAQTDGSTQTIVLLDDAWSADGGCRLLQAPEQIVVAHTPAEVDGALAAIEGALTGGLWAAGFFSYELGYLLEPKLASLLPAERRVPLLWMGLFREAPRLDAHQVRRWLPRDSCAEVCELRASLDPAAYRQVFDRARALIAAGETYQINLTMRLDFAFDGDPLALFAALRRRQRVSHSALIATPDFHILSLSPELFLRVRNGLASVRPMKGTAARAPTPAEDDAVRARLRADEKSRAENLMIVDLLRNDLSRLARPGDVRVTDLFTIETYRSLHQMTSGIEATLRPVVGLSALLRALFPCGSVTGAPKIRAMQIIHDLERKPRGVYCGAIGLLAPNGDAFFNVAIRTLVLRPDGRGEMGIGSGVIFDSDADAEYDECLLKAEFLVRSEPPLRLVETLRWQADVGYVLLERHLARLAASAAWFVLPYDDLEVRSALSLAARSFAREPMRVRLLLDEDGEASVTTQPLPQSCDKALRWRFATQAVSMRDPFLYHKTTRRPLYDAELAGARAAGCDEVLFCNERGELTEGAWTNLFVRRAGRLLTPPVACGLLDGTLRRELLDTGAAEEAVLRAEELKDAEAVLFGNSVRGLMPARQCADGSVAMENSRAKSS
ncbi:MAG: aminodeoxychorismate synthase component I [Rhodospirillales bacterium]|nr:aminodeoxychorismate synthase component I [Rhodospirillales bacterium]